MLPHSLGSPLLSSGGVHKCRNKHRTRNTSSASSLERSPGSSLSASPSVSINSDTVEPPKCDNEAITQVLAPGMDTLLSAPVDNTGFLVMNPTNTISRSNRRSSSLSQCMMKERMSYRAMGRDKEGYVIYALHVEESQGFKWNRNLSRLNGSHFGSDQDMPMFGSALYDVSSDSDSDGEEVSMHETVFISDQSF